MTASPGSATALGVGRREPARLSVVIIAKDEERDLPAALASVQGLANELVVLVSADTVDRTEELAKAAGAKTARRAFDDYAGQKQAALEMATCPWVLSLDADERVTPALAESIRTAIASGGPSASDDPASSRAAIAGYELPFEVEFMGHVMRWGGLGSESHVRLFRRARARFIGGLLHEGVQVDGRVSALEGGRRAGTVRHIPYRDIADYLAKLDRYTSLAAQKRFAAGKRFAVWHHLILPWEFFARTILKLGLLDGFPGVVWAGLSAYHSWLKYAKMKELEGSTRAGHS